jgi:hypothetical protein
VLQPQARVVLCQGVDQHYPAREKSREQSSDNHGSKRCNSSLTRAAAPTSLTCRMAMPLIAACNSSLIASAPALSAAECVGDGGTGAIRQAAAAAVEAAAAGGGIAGGSDDGDSEDAAAAAACFNVSRESLTGALEARGR